MRARVAGVLVEGRRQFDVGRLDEDADEVFRPPFRARLSDIRRAAQIELRAGDRDLESGVADLRAIECRGELGVVADATLGAEAERAGIEREQRRGRLVRL